MRVDALEYGNIVRCINHGQPALCNVEFRAMVVRGMVRIVALTTRPVKLSEQFLKDYGTRYWKAAGYDPCSLVATDERGVEGIAA